jgi:hypothetical protein
METRPIKVGAYANAASDPDEALVISVREHRGRGVFFAHVYDTSAGRVALSEQSEPCASPFVTTARRLLAAGYSPDRRIVMIHAGRSEIALQSTIGLAARFAVKQAVSGRPVFVKFDRNDVRQPRTGVLRQRGVSHPTLIQNNAPAGLRTSRSRHVSKSSSLASRSKRSRAA